VDIGLGAIARAKGWVKGWVVLEPRWAWFMGCGGFFC
jgi:hypothetical protein